MKIQKIVIPYEPRPPQPDIHNVMNKHRFSVIVAHRRLGKTVCTINQLIRKALRDTSGNGRYGYVAPYRSQAKSIAWDYVKHFTGTIPDRHVNEGELGVVPNGARIRFIRGGQSGCNERALFRRRDTR